MARAKQVTADKLERLGVQRLAALLEEHAGADAILRRKLKLALSALAGGDELAVPLERRIHTIGRSRSFLDWAKARKLANEIDHLRTTIAGPWRSGMPAWRRSACGTSSASPTPC